MHKKSVLLGVAGALTTFSLTALPVFATSPSLRPVQIRNQEIRENNEQFREDVRDAKMNATAPGSMRGVVKELNEDRRASNSAVRQTYRSERAKLHGERIDRRFSWYAERLQNIAERIQSRIDKEKADGKDVTKAQASLDAAKATLTQAIADGKTAVTMFEAIDVAKWDVQQPQVKAAIDQANKARSEFITARQQELDAVKALLTN
jgi:hypothetical protein